MHSKHRLTDRQCLKVKKAGSYSDGGGLSLKVVSRATSGVSKQWVYIYRVVDGSAWGKQIRMGLGRYPDVSLSSAREKAQEYNSMRAGDPTVGKAPIDPREYKRSTLERTARNSTKTFKRCADKYIQWKRGDWSNKKSEQQWTVTLDEVAEHFGDTPLDNITSDDVARCLEYRWKKTPETADRMLQRIKAVFMFAMAQTPPWITGHNPATRELIITKLPRRKNTPRGKHPSLHYNDMPKCFAYLRGLGKPIESDQRSIVYHAIELTILTGVRTSELVNAQWKEFNLGKKLWTIPLERLKNEKHVDEAFEVPLSTGAINILNIRRSIELRSRGGKVLNNKAFVFPSPIKENTPIHEGSMYNYIHGKASNGRMEPWPFFDSKQLDSETKEPKRISIHGFRSTLRDWGQGKAGFTFDLMEKVINHKLSSVQASYQRSQLTEKREEVMEAWWEYCSSKLQVKKSNVSPLRRKAK